MKIFIILYFLICSSAFAVGNSTKNEDKKFNCFFDCWTIQVGYLNPSGINNFLTSGYGLEFWLPPTYLEHMKQLVVSKFDKNKFQNFSFTTGFFTQRLTGEDFNRKVTNIGIAPGIKHLYYISELSKHQIHTQFELRLGISSAARSGESNTFVMAQPTIQLSYMYDLGKDLIGISGQYYLHNDESSYSVVGVGIQYSKLL